MFQYCYRKKNQLSIIFSCAGKKWSHLTTTEKRLADIKKHSLEDELETNKDDPGAGLMKIMQSMYEKGDSDTKRMIAKAWTEGQQKTMNPDLQL